MADQFKRNTAYKYRIGDILIGKPIFDQDKFLYLELGDKHISRVNIIGNIVVYEKKKSNIWYNIIFFGIVLFLAIIITILVLFIKK